MNKYDFLIVGGGIIGTAIANELAERKAGTIAVLEKEATVGMHASGRNSGVIHSGINQKPGSLKAKMCLKGSELLREYCRQKHIPMNECGTLVVARNSAEESVLQTLLELGQACDVEGLRMLNRPQLLNREPYASGVSALLSPTGATVDSLALLQSLAKDCQQKGVDFLFSEQAITVKNGKINTPAKEYTAKHIINCAGLYADKIAHQMNVGLNYQVIPFRGEYFEVKGLEIKSMLYQPPDLRFPFLSIHLTKETDGRVLAGPSAVLSFGRESYEKQFHFGDTGKMLFSRQFLRLIMNSQFIRVALKNAKTSFSSKAFLEQIQALTTQKIKRNQILPYRSGIRAQMVNSKGQLVNDILEVYQKDSTHILNAVSPGMTCSLAYAKHVVDRIGSVTDESEAL